MVRRPLKSLLIIGLALIGGFGAEATTVRKMSLTDLVAASDSVVRARALENRVRTDPDTLLNYTITRFEVLEDVKGSLQAGDHFEIEVIGGKAPGGDWATIVAEAPRFTEREEVVLFTRPATGSMRQIAGFFQGAIRVRTGASGDQEVVSPAVAFPDRLSPVNLATRTQVNVRAQGRAAPPASAVSPGATRAAGARAQRPDSAGPGRALGGKMKVDDFMQTVRDLRDRHGDR